MSKKIVGIIPSRYASTRFPVKALADIRGKSMIRRVYEQSCKASMLTDVIVATDHPRIYDHVLDFGGKVVMTGDYHQSGTDRCMEALQLCREEYDFVINIQGDEPFIQPRQIDLLASVLVPDTQLATLAIMVKSPEEIFSPNTAKVTINCKNEAIAFSRSPIPYLRNIEKGNDWLYHHTFYRHIGIYAYRSDILAQISALKPSSLELAESLEQLRWIENGYKIRVEITEIDSHGIDTPDDLQKILQSDFLFE